MHKFRNGDKVSYKGEIVIVAQVYPCEDDCSIFIPSLGYERNVLVSNLTAVALEDFSKGALYEWNGALFESVPSKYSRLLEIVVRRMFISNLTFWNGALLESVASNEVVNLVSFSRLRQIFLRLMLLIVTLFGSILFVTAASSVPARHEFLDVLYTYSGSLVRPIYDANGASVVRFANNTPKQPTPFRQLRYRFPLQV